MAHHIESNDKVALNAPGWHELGTVLGRNFSIEEAREHSGLGSWEPLTSETVFGVFNPGEPNEFRVSTGAGKVVIRSDDRSALGVVGPDWTPFLNATLFDLAYALKGAGGAEVEVVTAGSLRGGQDVWIMLKSSTVEFGVRSGDAVEPLLLLANNHAGKGSLRAVPGGERVVCANTLRMALRNGRYGWAFSHTSGLPNRTEEIAESIRRWHESIEAQRDRSVVLAKRGVNVAEVQGLFVDVIQRLDGAIPADPLALETVRERNAAIAKRERAVAALTEMTQTFEQERQQFGANAWTAINAATKWIEHTRAAQRTRTKDATSLKHSAFVGATADATEVAYASAAELLAV